MPSALDILAASMLQAIDSEEVITQITHGFSVGNVIRHNGSIYVKAQADTAANAEAAGIVRAVNGNEFTVVYGGRISGLSGLTAGNIYFLSDTVAGGLTSTEPVTAGVVSKPVLLATSNTSGIVFNMRGTVLGSGGVIGQSYVYSQTTAAATWVVQHNLGSLDVNVQCYDSSNQALIPNTVTITDQNTVTLTFNPAYSGKAVVLAALGYTSGLQRGAADIRLDRYDATNVQLSGIAGTSKRIEVNGYAVDCTTAKLCSKTDNTIDANGASAAAMSISTFYYMYVSNHLATFGPLTLRASTVAPTNGYLGVSGNASNWRYVGDCYLWSDGYFYDSDTIRAVRSEYNVIWKNVISYNTTASWGTFSSPSFREANNGTGQVRGYFLGDGKNTVLITSRYNGYSGGGSYWFGHAIAYDNLTNNSRGDLVYVNSGAVEGVSVAYYATIPTKGLHWFTQLEITSNPGSCTSYGIPYWYGSEARTLIPC